jgi:hypothetical protein
MHVDWTHDSPTDATLGTPLPGGGSTEEEDRIMLGTVLNLGVGQRLHDRFDIRAQLSTLIIPPTEDREDLKLAPLLMLTTGFGL